MIRTTRRRRATEWPLDLDCWAQRRIDDFDAGRLDELRRTLCEEVTPDFFGLTGRVLFGAADPTDVDRLITRLERDPESASEDDIAALTRWATRQCPHAASCVCSELQGRARRLVSPTAPNTTSSSTQRTGALR